MNVNNIVTESIASGRKNYVTEAVNRILSEGVTSGQKVAVIDDPTYSFAGCTGTVRKVSEDTGMAEVELANGTTVFMQVSLLIPL